MVFSWRKQFPWFRPVSEVLSMLLRHGMNQYFGAGFPKLRLSALQFDCLLEAWHMERNRRKTWLLPQLLIHLRPYRRIMMI